MKHLMEMTKSELEQHVDTVNKCISAERQGRDLALESLHSRIDAIGRLQKELKAAKKRLKVVRALNS